VGLLDSLSLERRILGRISNKLMMGMDPPQSDKKGFWDKNPQPVDSRPNPDSSLSPTSKAC
jgi:hypothetical protein